MRLIDADELLERWKFGIYDPDEGNILQVVAAKAVEDMPTVKPDPNWIPCAERLPTLNDDESYMEVQVTHKTWRGTLEVTYAVYMPEYGEWFDASDENKRDLDTVLAWMPLPEPYRGMK